MVQGKCRRCRLCTPGPKVPFAFAAWIRGHWHSEALHRIRESAYGEDASQIRTGNGLQVMATPRNWP